jgi:Domain of unknown function (DUF397)
MDLSRARWQKATRSGYQGCVEVAFVDGHVAMRDSKQEGKGPVLLFNAAEWQAFLAGARDGEFDRR